MNVKWIFFDLGNTIYDETQSDKERIEKLLKIKEYGVTYEQFWEEMKRASANYAVSPFAAARKKFGIEENVAYSGEKEVIFQDVAETLEILHGKYRLGVIANQPCTTFGRLEADGLKKYFDLCLLSEMERIEKPDPEIFVRALEMAKCRANEAVMIGDRLDNDIFPAKKLGFHTIRVRQGLGAWQKAPDDRYQPDFEVGCFKELTDILT